MKNIERKCGVCGAVFVAHRRGKYCPPPADCRRVAYERYHKVYNATKGLEAVRRYDRRKHPDRIDIPPGWQSMESLRGSKGIHSLSKWAKRWGVSVVRGRADPVVFERAYERYLQHGKEVTAEKARRTIIAKRDMAREGDIYCFYDPANGCPLYIGQSINGRKRSLNHYRDLRHGRHCNKHLQRLYDSRIAMGFDEPRFEIIESTNDLNGAEVRWIAEAARAGHRLCNATQGGECPQHDDLSRRMIATKSKANWQTESYRSKHQQAMARVRGSRAVQVESRRARLDAERLFGRVLNAVNKMKSLKRKQEAMKEARMFTTLTVLTCGGDAFIPMTRGLYAVIRRADADLVKDMKWAMSSNGVGVRPVTTRNNQKIKMRQILGYSPRILFGEKFSVKNFRKTGPSGAVAA